MAGILKVDKYQDFNGNDIMTSDGSGNLTLNNAALKMTPAFEVNGDGQSAPSIPNNTETKVTFTNEIVDTNSAYNTSDGKFTPQVAGKYYCYGRITFNSTADFDEIAIILKKNGSIFANTLGRNEFANGLCTYGIQTFNGSSDYLELYCKHQSGGSTSLHSSFNNGALCVFGAYKIIGA